MNLSKLKKSEFKVKAINEAAALSLAVTLFGSAASFASQSWSDQPSWASGDQSTSSPSASRRRTLRDQHYELSPFAPGSNNIALHVGQVFLMGDLVDKYEDSIGTQLHYTYGVSDMFGFDTSIGYSNHSEGKYSMTSLLTGLRMNLSWYDRVIPYAVAGLGFYKPNYQMTPTQSVSPVVFGIYVGPGVDLELTEQLFFGAQLTFNSIFGTTKVTPQGPVEINGTYASFFLHAGVTF
jgi:hypothetical protein